ncbi:putative 5xTM membrane BCR, YitT family [Tepidimonas sediminis]|uniref:Putative 5xTM membrane BCR, YitT family n=1 Tax=Tepidimonas sediminis TaxID=2588941 RepID=A0A554WUS6_9BURK|nr:YitT family protein [Tepidimonas sediminis]TSE27319.1 putative 5xTM membrane BCR, YitT family [Tepidimonas sediminis]
MTIPPSPAAAPGACADVPFPPDRHTWFDDAQALLTGTLLVALGLVLFRHAGFVTGGTVGLAFVLHYASGWPFGALVFAINLPFYALAWVRMGRAFTLKTVLAVGLLAAFTEVMPRWIVIGALNPWFAAVAGGLLIGVGFIILFRHRASLGGFNTLVLWLQERYGWRAGVVQLAIDAAILLAAIPWVGPLQLLLSVLGAALMNLTLAINHKPGRYVAY